jgi:hypothetical protein
MQNPRTSMPMISGKEKARVKAGINCGISIKEELQRSQIIT